MIAPAAIDLRRARLAAGLSQAEAGRVIGYSKRGWQDLEYGINRMKPALWELWRFKVARMTRIKLRQESHVGE